MSKNVREFFEKMQEFFPSTKNAYIESVEEYGEVLETVVIEDICLLYTSPSPRDPKTSRMPSSA